MPVAATSRWAYETVEIADRQQDVVRALRALGEANDKQIAAHLRWPINRVTPRRGELVEMNLATRARVGFNELGRKVSYWRLVLHQGDLFDDAPRGRAAMEGARG